MLIYHNVIVWIFAAALEDQQWVKTDLESSHLKTKIHFDQWGFNPLVVETAKGEDVHQGTHPDTSAVCYINFHSCHH